VVGAGAGRGAGLLDFRESYFPYIEPGSLWWIFDRSSASRRGYPGRDATPFPAAVDPGVWDPSQGEETGSVLLIDEVDKAEPDFPNNLLVPLGSHQFVIEEVSQPLKLGGDGVPHPSPLVIITSNRERELPEAFVRRCVVFEIPAPLVDDLIGIGKVVFSRADRDILETVAKRLEQLRGSESLSTAEYLDAVGAVLRLKASGQALTDVLLRSSWRSNPY
jgi:MoxR-like ATPase